MKHVYLLLLVLSFAVPRSILASSSPLEITIAYENTPLPPYYFGAGDEIPGLPGIAVELLQIVDKRLPEVTIKFRRAPWKRCKNELRDGTIEAIFPASFKPARKKIGKYPRTQGILDSEKRMLFLSYYFYAVKGTGFRWDGELEGKWVIGAPTGYSIVDDLKKHDQEVDDQAATTRQNLLKLITGRVQAVAAQGVTADPLIQSEQQFQRVEKLSPPINTKANYLIFSHQFINKHQQLAEKFWSTLQDVREEKLEELALKYVQK